MTQFRDAKADFRAQGAAHINPDGTVGEVCWLDLHPINYEVHGHPHSWALDHAIPVTVRPDLVMDPTNFRHAHLVCTLQRRQHLQEQQ